MNNTKGIKLFTINVDEYTAYINTVVKCDGTFKAKSSIRLHNPYLLKIQQKKCREQNKERITKYNKEYYQNNKESCDKYNIEYKRNNKDRVKIWGARNNVNRKGLGYNPMNESFKGSHFYHTFIDNDPDIGIYIPAKLHNSVWHGRNNQKTMDKINNLAFEWLKNNKDC